MQQDIFTSKTIFSSNIKLWQIPANVYSGIYVSFAELMGRVDPCGEVGRYLVSNTFTVNEWYGQVTKRMAFPHGEVWTLGDQPTVSVLLLSDAGSKFHMEK